MNIITSRIKKAIILIEDFKIPSRKKDHVYDKYGDKECSLELITPHMKKDNHLYNLLLPNYSNYIFKDNDYHPALSGYPVIFQNLLEDCKKIKSHSFISRFFIDKTNLIRSLIRKKSFL